MSGLHPIRILCVEDERSTARLLQKQLVRAGYEVDLAYDGEEGLATWLAGPYDVLTTDHDMPRKKGLEFIKDLASKGPLPPTIMITGHGNELVAVEAMKLGADDYVLKDTQGLFYGLLPQRIEEALARRRLRDEKVKADLDLQAQKDMLEAIFETSPYIMMVVNQEGRVENINRAGTSFSGGLNEDLRGLLGGEVFHCLTSFHGQGCGRNPDCPYCPVRTKVMHTFQTGESIHEGEGRLTVRTDAGDLTLDLLISTTLVKVEARDMVLVTIADVTSRKKAEEDLRVHRIELEIQNEQLRDAQTRLEQLTNKYLDLYDFAPVGYFTLNGTGLILEANLTAVRLLGEERKTLIKAPFSRFVCQGSGNAYYLHLKQVFEEQSKRSCEIELARKDGTPFTARLESVPTKNQDGRITGCRTVILDVTERSTRSTH